MTKQNNITVIGPSESSMYTDDPLFVNCTSKSKNWGIQLSPFIVGPCRLYNNAPCEYSKNVENAWQYSKVYSSLYPSHVDQNNNPTTDYFRWAKIGFLTERGIRYPVGKGVKPAFAWWDGEKLDYVNSRKKIYVPCYGNTVKKTEAFKKLCDIYKQNGRITLWDFDSYDRRKAGRTLDYILNDSTRPMGHAFVLEMLMVEELDLENV